jgi:GNAT superfamily N-acetyltransferase
MSFRLRAAAPEDVRDLLRLIRGLAEYERLTHLLEVTPEGLARHLFGERPAAEAWVAELDAGEGGAVRGAVVGFALFFTNFSTFLGRPGLYLEDRYVEPAHRRLGIGKALLAALGRLALERGCGRFEWSVLDWNADAIGFYRSMGAQVLPDWRLCRVTGAALRGFGG